MSSESNYNKTELVPSKSKIKWNDENELILKKWADKALCFKTMHDRATKKYWCLNAWFSIPVIILSTLTGSGNFAQSSFKEEYAGMLILLIASANIFSAILSTIAQYINVAGLTESHRFAALTWDKYARSIQVELAKNRSERSDAETFIGKAQEDFNRLMEISPVFSNDIIGWFNHLIDTGDFDESNKYACGPCCYEWFCFPCGCKGCKHSECTKPKEDNNCSNNDKYAVDDYEGLNKNYKEIWKELELPDILGRMMPTRIADPSKDPANIVEEDKQIQVDELPSGQKEEDPMEKYRVIDDLDV